MTISGIPASLSYAVEIDELKAKYQKDHSMFWRPVDFAPGLRSIWNERKGDNSIGDVERGFIGSYDTVSVETVGSETFVHESCLAAPRVSLLAKNLFLGKGEFSMWSITPMTIYAPECLSITTDCLTVDQVSFLREPKEGMILCNRLVLVTHDYYREDPECFEIFQSFIANEATVEKKEFSRELAIPLYRGWSRMQDWTPRVKTPEAISSVYLGDS